MLLRILRNIISLLTGQVIAKLFSFACVIVLARKFGVQGFGIYGTVMAYLTLFAILADGGTSTVIVRDVAQNHTRCDEYFSHVLPLKLLLSLGAYGIMVLLGSIWNSKDYPFWLIVSCGLFLFPEAIRRLGSAMLSGYERMDLVAAFEVLGVVLRYLPFLWVVFYNISLHVAFLCLVVLWGCLAGLWLVITRRYCLTRWFVPIRLRQLWDILYESFPFGILSVLSVIYFKADTIMLSKMQGSIAVGFYESAYKFIEASMFIPVSVVNVLLPVMSRHFVADKISYNRVYLHSTRLLAIGILPIVLFVSFFAKEIIMFVYDETYLPSASALAVLIWALFLIFVNAPVGNIIATSKTMHAFLPYAIGNTLFNIVLNFFLIPKYSFLGASLATVLAECTGFAMQLYFANQVVGHTPYILWMLAKILAAGAITGGVLYAVQSFVTFPLKVLILISVYIGCIWAFNLIEREDKQVGIELLNMAKAKLRGVQS